MKKWKFLISVSRFGFAPEKIEMLRFFEPDADHISDFIDLSVDYVSWCNSQLAANEAACSLNQINLREYDLQTGHEKTHTVYGFSDAKLG